MTNAYFNDQVGPQFWPDGGRPKDISKKGEVYTKPTKVNTSAKFTSYRDSGGEADKDFKEHGNW